MRMSCLLTDAARADRLRLMYNGRVTPKEAA